VIGAIISRSGARVNRAVLIEPRDTPARAPHQQLHQSAAGVVQVLLGLRQSKMLTKIVAARRNLFVNYTRLDGIARSIS
jgi:hypothetical protein